ncbi:hypothetical protein FOPG_04383 [Fusarium oxysporum f. sp. conglutinans race 2 54008]|uniref:Uncharacterized protein n=2 Tax=Fusarium oxysporum TaxID=5507 RepID=X0LL44_FUSOX|nr:hypothetical protein FOPG_04383 [Fusarium oxysporum f. sp. conglutinans race 2 54008]EXM26633.1 hypothetical protein FOTG_06901 [Fusarium oxysporum f. sp. vasinfectum 25433]KAI8405486.1 hypothetical protein FOFC_14966 [Fusarium oxysporum]KAJ0148356.1 Methionine adenosyltransferase 2 subunit beta [Fusarium oxysporum f. sp. albedinis]
MPSPSSQVGKKNSQSWSELSVSQPCGMHMVWCAAIKTYSCPTRREGLGAELSRDNVCQGRRSRSNPRIDRGQGPILGVLGAGRMGSRAWKGGTGRAWGRENGTEEERGNLRDMKKQPKTNASINHQIR